MSETYSAHPKQRQRSKAMQAKVYYYAHSKLIYNTTRERAEEKFLKKKFKVVNPNTDMGEMGSMIPYLQKISCVDGVVFSEFQKHIGKGVYEEVKHSILLGKPTYCLRKTLLGYKLIPIKEIPEVSDEYDWKVGYAKVSAIHS